MNIDISKLLYLLLQHIQRANRPEHHIVEILDIEVFAKLFKCSLTELFNL